jgi:nucleoside-diphosphate-sugar epimerase
MKTNSPPYVILGCGYVGTRLAQSLRTDGVQVRVCARRVALLEPLRAAGAEVHYLDAGRSHQFGPAMLGLDQPIVVYAIPGVRDLPQGEAVRRAASASLKVHARAFIYLSSSAVYGRSEGSSNDEWVDEDSAVASNDPEAGTRLTEEAAVQSVAQNGLRVAMLRLSAVYGPQLSATQPARGVRQRLRSGQYKLWDGGRYYFSRIHVDDLVQIIRRTAERMLRGGPNPLYLVGDDHPCPQGEYAAWLCEHLHLPVPASADSHLSSGPSHVVRGRRLRNTRLKQELGLQLLYPTFREGELALDAVEKTGELPSLSLLDASAAEKKSAEAPAAPAADAPPPLPTALPGLDIGVSLGKEPLGVSLIALSPGQEADAGQTYLVLTGQLVVTRGNNEVTVGPRTLIPAHARIRNAGSTPAELVAVKSGPRG